MRKRAHEKGTEEQKLVAKRGKANAAFKKVTCVLFVIDGRIPGSEIESRGSGEALIVGNFDECKFC